MKGERDFTTNEVTKLCELLRLTDQEKRIIFFGNKVDKNDTKG
jgi:hypothetical protein